MANISENGSEAILEIMERYNFNPKGIVHVGANAGWEYLAYCKTMASLVLYIEPIPELFVKLKKNIEHLPGHIPIQAVCSDLDGEYIQFNVSSNDGLSSSILPLGNHAKLHPSIKYTNQFGMYTTKLDTLLERERIGYGDVDYLVIDVQGAELKVLVGSRKLLESVKFLVLEVSDFALYEGGCTLEDLKSFLNPLGFELAEHFLQGQPGSRVGDALFVKSSIIV